MNTISSIFSNNWQRLATTRQTMQPCNHRNANEVARADPTSSIHRRMQETMAGRVSNKESEFRSKRYQLSRYTTSIVAWGRPSGLRPYLSQNGYGQIRKNNLLPAPLRPCMEFLLWRAAGRGGGGVASKKHNRAQIRMSLRGMEPNCTCAAGYATMAFDVRRPMFQDAVAGRINFPGVCAHEPSAIEKARE